MARDQNSYVEAFKLLAKSPSMHGQVHYQSVRRRLESIPENGFTESTINGMLSSFVFSNKDELSNDINRLLTQLKLHHGDLAYVREQNSADFFHSSLIEEMERRIGMLEQLRSLECFRDD